MLLRIKLGADRVIAFSQLPLKESEYGNDEKISKGNQKKSGYVVILVDQNKRGVYIADD